MKKCPYCAEEIQDEAIFCRYCEKYLTGFKHGLSRGGQKSDESYQHEEVAPKGIAKKGLLNLLLISDGRISRSTYFSASFIPPLAGGALYYLLELVIPEDSGFLAIASLLIVIIIMIPLVILVIKRFHDLDKSGWYSLLAFIPLVNIIVGWILILKTGSKGSNRYGVEPN